MFNIGGTELVLILIIAFVVVGPQDLPKVARALGRAVRWIKELIRELKAETGFDELEKEFKDVQTEVMTVSSEVKETVKDADIRKELRSELNDINQELGATGRDVRDSFRETITGSAAVGDVKLAKKPLGFKEFKQRNGYEKPAPQPEAPAPTAENSESAEPAPAEVPEETA